MSRCNIYRIKSSLLFWIFILTMVTRGREMAHALLATSISATSEPQKMPEEDMTVPKFSPPPEKNRSPRTKPMSLGRPSISPQPLNLSAFIRAPSAPNSVDCFENISHRLGAASAEDCRIVVDHIILGYPNPMGPKTFGWNDGKSMSKRRVPCLVIKPQDPGTQETHTARSFHQIAKILTHE